MLDFGLINKITKKRYPCKYTRACASAKSGITAELTNYSNAFPTS